MSSTMSALRRSAVRDAMLVAEANCLTSIGASMTMVVTLTLSLSSLSVSSGVVSVSSDR